ncbi:hypothetical protein SAMN04488104_100954 [Algoriphagus faecimaris]|uniref:DUF6603 domain-containing protein n=1 Tax=Algoriphagus faecimaris TaxID=686796 RepID=A0A1G6QHA3_9BACT|nr:DUF6603 domain-containing protein [Algoriphagus faecimaris]SDC91531.1 hypothetical protein SAMN04488104_100954 [Algoriphagus faecimaris]
MAVINLPFESLLSDSGISQLKGQLDQVLSNPSDTAEMVLEHFKDDADLPIKIPVDISKVANQYIIEAVDDLLGNPQDFFLYELESVLKKFQIKLNESTSQIDEFLIEAETELQSFRDKVTDQLSKIPFELVIDDNNGAKEFSINQTQVIEAKVHGVDVKIVSTSLTFTLAQLSQLQCGVELLLPDLEKEDGSGPHILDLNLAYGNGVFNGTAQNIPAARLQGIQATLSNVTLVIQNGDFQAGTLISGELVFDFLDNGKIDFGIALLNSGEVKYQAQNPQGKELKKGSISVFFEKIEVVTSPSSASTVDIRGWVELPGFTDSNAQSPVKTTFSFAYLDPHFEFTGAAFNPVPIGFGTVTFDEVFIRINKNGTLNESKWEGKVKLPLFDDGQLDFKLNFENTATSRYKLQVSNPSSQPLRYGGFELNLQQYEMLYENESLQDVTGNGELTMPEITSGTPIQVDIQFARTASNENLTIAVSDFGTPEVAGCKLEFSQIRFLFVNNAFTNSQITGKLKLPDTTDGAGINFNLDIANQGDDFHIQLTGSPQDNQLVFGSLTLALNSFDLHVVNKQLESIEGEGQLLLPGLSQAFDFDFSAQLNGSSAIYEIQLNDVEAAIEGFRLSFTQLNLRVEKGQQFQASASGSLTLPVFEEGGELDFEVNFDRSKTYQIEVDSGAQLVRFGDFELRQLDLELEVDNGVLQDFSGSGELQIPVFNSASQISFKYFRALDQYKIESQNPVNVQLYGGALHISSLDFEIRHGGFHHGQASGNFRLPDATGGAGIQFALEVDDNGKGYEIKLSGEPSQNTIEFGPLSLSFSNFELKVEDKELKSVNGGGSLLIPGLDDSFSFNISFEKNGSEHTFIIQLNDVSADLESFNLQFEKIRIETVKDQSYSAEINGEITIPVFDGNPVAFDLEIQSDSSYEIKINGVGQTANFGIFELSDLGLNIEVENGTVKNATGGAKFYIPEISQTDQPFAVQVDYSKNGDEIFELSASSLPPVDLAVFTLNIASLAFLIKNGAFESANLSGTMVMPVFTSGGSLNYAFEVENEGDSYTVEIASSGILKGSGLELKDLDFELLVQESGLQSISGQAQFKLPGGDSFVGVSISYTKAINKLAFVATSLPTFKIGDIDFNFSQFGFSIQNSTLTDAIFAGNLKIPACEPGHDELDFEFQLSDGNDYIIKANPDEQRTELKLGDVSLFIEKFDLQILSGDLESITAVAGLGFSGFEQENGSGPAEIAIGFSYEQSTKKYQISLSQDQKIKVGGFAFTLKTLNLSFTPDSLEYPFAFEGELEIPGLRDASDQQAKVEINFTVPSKSNFTGSIASTAVFHLGNVKISISSVEVEKTGSDISVELKGELELEGLGGDSTAIAVDIMIDSEGAFHVLGEVTPSTNALKVVDVPSIVRIYLSKIGLSRTASNEWDFILGGLIENQIVIPGMDNLLPSQINLKELQFGNSFDIDLDIRWPSGLSVSFGGAQSEALIPVNGKFGNAVSLDAIKITYKNNNASGTDLGISFSGASIVLGPVAASVEGLGIEATLTKAIINNGIPQGNANFGIVNIDVRFKPPTGLGVALDTPVFSGGGYLFFDDEKGEYAGAVELSFMNMFAVSAIGIINSKMPDGQPGTSVLFIVSVEFGTGIALGFGFFLSGLGGILGIHRTIQVERLRDGVRSGTIQNILFPKNIIANINKILTDIKEVFPVKRDQFVLGPMAAITWGVPTLLRVDLGIAIEFANPVRFGILGVLRVILPDENAALIKIQVAFLGMIDFEKGMLSFDASLFDSKVLTFGLEGDMVLRISWGAKPDFVISVGGFHPRFNPPTHLQIPMMKRLTLKILSGNPRLTLSCYFAVTSNTVQFGAGIDFYFGVSGFKVVGEFGFDVLFQFSPFRFIADARARLAVKAGSTTLLSLSLEFSLEGPTPWRAKGTAKFKVLFFSVKVKFDVTWGDKRDTTLPDISVLPLLVEALEDIQNWRSVINNPSSPGLRMKGLVDAGDLILTPNGSIEINQKIVPLNVEISKFGQFNPADYTKFEIIEVRIGSSDADYGYVKDSFASANFLDLKDNEKLSLPSFNEEDAGVKLSGTDALKCGNVVDREVEYEQMVMDEANNSFGVVKLKGKGLFTRKESNFFARTGAVGQSTLSANQSRILNPKKVKLKKPGFSVVDTDDLSVVSGGQNQSYLSAVKKASSAQKGTAKSIQVVASDILEL